MTSAPVLEIDALLAPIPGEKPAGEPHADVLRRELDEHRREPIPGDATTNHWKADWPRIIKLTTTALTKTSKDVFLAVRLLEAVTKVHGAAGLRDGLRLLQKLFEVCWERLYPIPDEGDTTDIREGYILWLNDAEKGGKFPRTVMGIPLLRTQLGSFSLMDMQNKERAALYKEALTKATREELENLRVVHADLVEARQALKDLVAQLDLRRVDQDQAPNYLSSGATNNLGLAIERCIEAVANIAAAKNFELIPGAATPTAAAPPDTTQPTSSAGRTPSSPTPVETREGLYRQIEQIAAALQRLEPHSPIPLLLERCVKLGKLAFPQLMRAIVREKNTLDELDRLLGLDEKEKEKK